MIKLFDASYESRETDAAPGTVVDNHLGIACKPGILRPAILQRPGKKRMSADELLRGFLIPIGTQL
jgi:methionyl-tRNA formyltransferase